MTSFPSFSASSPGFRAKSAQRGLHPYPDLALSVRAALSVIPVVPSISRGWLNIPVRTKGP